MTKKNKLIEILGWIGIAISIIVIITMIWFHVRVYVVHKLDYKESTMSSMDYLPIRPKYWNEEEYVEILQELVDYDNFTWSKYNFLLATSGDCNLITKHIRIDYDLSFEGFIFAFTHELTHLKYFTGNERFTNFHTWLVLYESDNFYFNNVAKCYADMDFKGQIDYEYSCAGYIEEYLRSK